jgi:hypothetical protein
MYYLEQIVCWVVVFLPLQVDGSQHGAASCNILGILTPITLPSMAITMPTKILIGCYGVTDIYSTKRRWTALCLAAALGWLWYHVGIRSLSVVRQALALQFAFDFGTALGHAIGCDGACAWLRTSTRLNGAQMALQVL